MASIRRAPLLCGLLCGLLSACGIAQSPPALPLASSAAAASVASASTSVSLPVAAPVLLRASMCDEAALRRATSPDVRIRLVSIIRAGNYAPAPTSGEIEGLPSFCRVEATAAPTSDSSIDFELWLPGPEAWNGKLVATGNGGYSTTPTYGDMAYALRQGYAVVGGDTGHHEEDMQWGVNHPEKIFDWSSRSIHAITEAARHMAQTLRARAPQRAYYYGCSTGGQQGFAEVQRYPADFDGVIAGAPSYDRTALHTEFIWRWLANRNPRDAATRILTAQRASIVSDAAIKACDGLDGVLDGVISDPASCGPRQFDPASLLCKDSAASSAQGASCLSAAELGVVRKIHQGATNPRTGAQIYPGLMIGSESSWGGMLTENVLPPRIDFWRLWVMNDASWDWWKFDFDRDLIPAFAKIAPLIDQTSADIGAFKQRGGKLIVFHGFGDSSVSPKASMAYFDRLVHAQGSQERVDEFARLFMVPGMGHCGGGNGAVVFGNAGATPPVVDADHDLLHAMDRWVERGEPPARIVASHVEDDMVSFTRPLCPYPRRPVYTAGDVNDAKSFSCR